MAWALVPRWHRSGWRWSATDETLPQPRAAMPARSHHPQALLRALAVAALAFASPAAAQYQRLGFVSAGVGGAPQEAYLQAQLTVAAGFIARFGPPVGVSVGIRSITAYSRLEA